MTAKRSTKIPKLKLIRAYELKSVTHMNWHEIARAIGRVNGDVLKDEVRRVEKEGLRK